MENIDKGLTAPKWVLIVWPQIPQMRQNFFAQFFCTSVNVVDFKEKMVHWPSVVREQSQRTFKYSKVSWFCVPYLAFTFFYPRADEKGFNFLNSQVDKTYSN